MKTVTDNFLYLQNQPGSVIITRVYYKRRYWDTITEAYIYEASWTELEREDFSDMSSIAHQLDTKTLSEFKVSNLSLKLKNSSNQWDENNPDGFFAADPGSLFGYEPYLMKFQVRSGFVDSAGTEDTITLFTGVAVDYNFDSRSRTCAVNIESLQRLLLDADADEVSESVTLETVGTGDGFTKEFYTAHNGVGKIETVTVNSVTMTKGTDYDVSNLNSLDEPAQIILAKAATSEHLVKCTYRHWKKNKTVDSLISDLVAEAGITTTDIDNGTLGTISNNISMSSKADFEAGTNTSVDTTKDVGTMQADPTSSASIQLWNSFASGTPSSNGWTVGGSAIRSFSIDSGQLKMVGDTSGDDDGLTLVRAYSSPIAFGKWEFKVTAESGGGSITVWFLANADTYQAHDGYYLQIEANGAMSFLKSDEGSSGADVLDTATASAFTTQRTVRVVRYPDGLFRIYVDGVKVMEAEDSGYVSGDRFAIDNQTSGTSNEFWIDDLYIPNSSISVTHQSQTIDTISGLSAWGNLTVNQESKNITFTLETRSSTDGSSWDAWTATTSAGLIQSAVKRYIQVKIAFSLSTSTLPEIVPTIFDYTVEFTSDRVFIAIGNFSGDNCYNSIQELSRFSDFEWGVDATESFFFRARNTSTTPVLAITQSNFLSEVEFMKTDYARLYSGVRVKFGQFISEQFDTADVRNSALTIINNRKILEISGQALVNKDTNVSDAIASIYKDRLKGKRKILRISTKYLPQIELSDTVSVTLEHDPTASYHFLDALVCNVTSTNHSPQEAKSVFELEEIL